MNRVTMAVGLLVVLVSAAVAGPQVVTYQGYLVSPPAVRR